MTDLKQNIVVVDDDEYMNQALKRLLTAAGFHATTFPSAESLLQDGAAAAAAADCLVLDVQLPGLSGFELRRKLQQGGADPPVIFITAYEDPAARAEAKAAGAIEYLTKPFPAQSLLRAIQSTFHQERKGPDGTS